MKTIHKYHLQVGINRIDVAGDFKPMCVQLQQRNITLWAEVTSTYPVHTVDIHVIGTGYSIDSELRYIGTVQIPDGTVWHAYW